MSTLAKRTKSTSSVLISEHQPEKPKISLAIWMTRQAWRSQLGYGTDAPDLDVRQLGPAAALPRAEHLRPELLVDCERQCCDFDRLARWRCISSILALVSAPVRPSTRRLSAPSDMSGWKDEPSIWLGMPIDVPGVP